MHTLARMCRKALQARMKAAADGNRAYVEPEPEVSPAARPSPEARRNDEDAKLKALADARLQAYKDRKEIEVRLHRGVAMSCGVL